jgi:hypothetical protein
MGEIKLIDKNTDISALKMEKYRWDLVVGNRPYQVVNIEGYVHTIGGKWGENSMWCYPRDEEPSYHNLVEYDGSGAADWGIVMYTACYIKSKWDEKELRSIKRVMITRNGKDFFLTHNLNKALYLIDVIREHPLNFDLYDFEQRIVGRKIWWRSQPAIITRWIGDGQACVIIEPDGIDAFETPREFLEDNMLIGDEGFIKADIFDEHIWWFRE